LEFAPGFTGRFKPVLIAASDPPSNESDPIVASIMNSLFELATVGGRPDGAQSSPATGGQRQSDLSVLTKAQLTSRLLYDLAGADPSALLATLGPGLRNALQRRQILVDALR
jgi:hypothetical protein